MKELLFGATFLFGKKGHKALFSQVKEDKMTAGLLADCSQAWLPTRSLLLQVLLQVLLFPPRWHTHSFMSHLQPSLSFLGASYLWSSPANHAPGSPPGEISPAYMGQPRVCRARSLLDGGFHRFQGRRFILLELRPCSMCFSFHKVCCCLNRHAGRQLVALSNITQPGSRTVCQFRADNE